jgi:hypothetical protein
MRCDGAGPDSASPQPVTARRAGLVTADGDIAAISQHRCHLWPWRSSLRDDDRPGPYVSESDDQIPTHREGHMGATISGRPYRGGHMGAAIWGRPYGGRPYRDGHIGTAIWEPK